MLWIQQIYVAALMVATFFVASFGCLWC